MTEPAVHPGQWRLARIEVVNWGTFSGRTVIDVARAGHLITGASGSGKSSLLDAIATVLTPRNALRFNAAAQESATRNDDRTLMSYVRGAWSRESDAGMHRAVSRFLRVGPTWSGIALRFDNGGAPAPEIGHAGSARAPRSVSLVKLFQVRGRSVEPGDLKEWSFIADSAVTLAEFEPLIVPTVDVRAIKRQWPDAEVASGSQRSYFARIERLLGPGITALSLLHRTQSAKNLGTLDTLFRGYMLEKPGTFDLAENAVHQFGELRAAHLLVVEARQQLEALRAMEPTMAGFERAESDAAEASRLLDAMPAFQDALRLRLVAQDLDTARTSAVAARTALDAARAERQEAREALGAATQAARDLGSDRTELARAHVDRVQQDANRVLQVWTELANTLAEVGIEAPETGDAFAELQQAARSEVEAGGTERSMYEETHAVGSARRALEHVEGDVEALQRQRSNVPAPLLRARQAIAAHLGVDHRAVPFVGELLSVDPAHADWTGAIERVLRSLALTLAVRTDLLPAVRAFVDREHLGVRLVYEVVDDGVPSPRPAATDRSLLHRVRAEPGAFERWVNWRVARDYDFACVLRPRDLDDHDRAVTRSGQVRRGDRYEKDDRAAVDDRTRWVLGSDTTAKLDALLALRAELRDTLRRAEATLERAERAARALTDRRYALKNALLRAWADVDRQTATDRVRRAQDALAAASRGDTDLERALANEQRARTDLATAEDLDQSAAIADARATALVEELSADERRLRLGVESAVLDAADADQLERRFRTVQRSIGRAQVLEVGAKVLGSLHRERDDAQGRAEAARRDFLGRVMPFRSTWTALVSELTDDIGDRNGYRALRADIEARGLPKHEQAFLRLLQDRSREMLGHLLSDLREAPKLIEERTQPVNESLLRSEYDRDRFLQIRVRPNRSHEVQQFISELRSGVDGSLADEDLAAAERRFSLIEGLMTRLASSDRRDVEWRQRCLDTREHVTFQAVEQDGAGIERNVHDSSAGLSGGQRQKLVVFCLAAALRYQLTDEDDEVPTYGTIILDEAFDKADASYTRNAMDVFTEFGFHMILATPMKLLGTIEPYVGAVTTVSNSTRAQSLVGHIRWGR